MSHYETEYAMISIYCAKVIWMKNTLKDYINFA